MERAIVVGTSDNTRFAWWLRFNPMFQSLALRLTRSKQRKYDNVAQANAKATATVAPLETYVGAASRVPMAICVPKIVDVHQER